MVLINQTIINISFGEQKSTTHVSSKCVSHTDKNKINVLKDSQTQNDTTRPLVNITYPAYPPTVTTGKIIINGTASDSGSGIQSFCASAHTFPFNGTFTVLPASSPSPLSPNNWSHWSVPLIINTTGTYRVVIGVGDNAGNRNYAETTINAALEKNNTITTKGIIPKIAFVRPTFTEAAYQHHGFYDFYFKYGFPSIGKNITTDLDMLTVKIIPSTPKFVGLIDKNLRFKLTNYTALIPIDDELLFFWTPFSNHLKKVVPNSTLTVVRDEDVDDGHLFYPDNNKTNAYDVLLLFHNEYVTQKEYDNLRQFVKNGGTIVFIDGNQFYAEVHYDKANHTITLVKGHDWEYDGKTARRSVPERWYNETKEWVGGNYLIGALNSRITFTNNPFNYTHYEEQFVNNPKDEIIIDYGIKFQKDYVKDFFNQNRLPTNIRLEDIVVATYQLNYGKGKVIMLSLYGQSLAENQEFMRFFDTVILPKALCPKFQTCHLS